MRAQRPITGDTADSAPHPRGTHKAVCGNLGAREIRGGTSANEPGPCTYVIPKYSPRRLGAAALAVVYLVVYLHALLPTAGRRPTGLTSLYSVCYPFATWEWEQLGHMWLARGGG
jgi:hypothetical protein